MPDLKPKAVIYARFSKHRYAEQSTSIEKQIKLCRAHCEANDWDVIGVYYDYAISGRTDKNRPEYQKAVQHVVAERCAFVAYEMSRWARSTKDALSLAETIQEAQGHLVSLKEAIDTTTAMGRFAFTLMAALNHLERERISERTRDAMQHHQANGKRMSRNPPIGWIDDPYRPGYMIPDPDETAALKMMKERYEAGDGFLKIARQLNEAGYEPREMMWHAKTVARIIKKNGWKKGSVANEK